VAALGAVFQARVENKVVELLSSTPVGQGRAEQIGHAVSSGQAGQAVASVPRPVRGAVAGAARQGFVTGLNELFIIAAAVAFVGAVIGLVLVRQSDFVMAREPEAVAAG
jgi:hypothetical protein